MGAMMRRYTKKFLVVIETDDKYYLPSEAEVIAILTYTEDDSYGFTKVTAQEI